MSAVEAANRGRLLANSLIAESGCAGVVRRKTGVTGEDPLTLEEVAIYATIYTGASKIRFPDTRPGVGTIPGAVVIDQAAILSLPVGAAGAGDVTTDDVWECTANPMDGSLIGRKFRITGLHSQTYATAHRFPVEETS